MLIYCALLSCSCSVESFRAAVFLEGKTKLKSQSFEHSWLDWTTNNFVAYCVRNRMLKRCSSSQEKNPSCRSVGSSIANDETYLQMEIRSDLMDAHLYAFKRTILQEVLEQKEAYRSIRLEVLPYLVRNQLKSALSGGNGASVDETGNNAVTSIGNLQCLSQHRIIAPSAFKHGVLSNSNGHRCCVYIASKSKYCHRLNSIQAYCDINRDVVGEVSHLSGYSFSAHNNIIHPSSVLGSKTTLDL
ncbi:hypothetical protein PR202_ga16257 [Eleusine coracana subsp. coracana]|uniref:Translation initiation factor eIF2B subunit gamma n=1 Tax=Eleusine coracana subsp. coracana TaxID=191504 RepID=A0AAV5CL74_ELECO|nr:hypothetical protein PR202_ga16257 [Eleusine coracana subsp. coracana]